MKDQELIENALREEAKKAGVISQFLSNYPYDQRSYEDGFMKGALFMLDKLTQTKGAELTPITPNNNPSIHPLFT